MGILAKRAGLRHDIAFNFLGELDRFRQRVSGEVRQINELFPEYTPHDEQYHLKGLFHVADTVLGRDRLENMNSAELFVLAVGLYGHDWGMAVSKSEKQYILTDKLPNGMKKQDFWILSDERDRFAAFAQNNRLKRDPSGRFNEIPNEAWREYVRQTHHLRSAERIRRFFDPIDKGVSEAASRVAEGLPIHRPCECVALSCLKGDAVAATAIAPPRAISTKLTILKMTNDCYLLL